MLSFLARTAVILSMAGYGIGTAMAQAASNHAASNRSATLDCTGGKAQIMGSNNRLTISGRCSTLEIAGSGNVITVEFGVGATVKFLGSNNTVTRTSIDGKAPKVSYSGYGNTMKPPI